MRKRGFFIVGIFIWLFCSTAAVWAANDWTLLTEQVHKSERDTRQYQLIKLENGMTVLLVSDQEAPNSLAALALPVGSLEDPDNQLGLAHYLEHMIFMGSKRYPQSDSLSQYLKMHGGSDNASTASYRTAYYLEVGHEGLEGAVDRLSAAIAEPLFGSVNADRERNAVNAEMTLARSRDGLRMAQVSAETLNPAHPASRFSGGNLETLKDKPGSKLHDELLAFYQRYYSANLMVAVLYSNQPLDKLAGLAAKTFGRVPNRNATVPEITAPAVTAEQQGIIIHYVPAQPKKQLRLEFRVENNSQAFRSKTDTYISYLIENRGPGTLSDWLQQEGLADSIGAGADPMINRNGGIFAISVSLTDKGLKQRDKVIAAVFHYLQMLRDKGIQQSYFDEMAHVLDLDFRYPSITRDMSYVEWIVDTMLRAPVEHVLDAPYIADKYDPEAISRRLQEMTPQTARIWFIGENEPHNKLAYFVNAPYQVDKITSAQYERWTALEKTLTLSLPQLNPYIPDDFSLLKAGEKQDKPGLILEEEGIRVLHMTSRYFADEPKSDITVSLRTKVVSESARAQILYSLMDYIAGQHQDRLNYLASIGGISFSTSSFNGIQFNASGFSQRLPDLLLTLIQGYFSFTPTEEQLQQAKSWYREQLDAADKAKSFELSWQAVQVLSRVPYSERAERRKLLDSVTVKDILDYRTRIVKTSALEMLSVGNTSQQQARSLAQNVRSSVGLKGTEFWRGRDVIVNKEQLAILHQRSNSTDSALSAVYVPHNYDETTGRANSYLLGQIVQPWFYEQLRTKEQLGYAVFAIPTTVGRQSGLAFVLQSNNHRPGELYQRYQAFYPEIEKRLEAMSSDDFAQYKQGLIKQLSQNPQTLEEEAGRFSRDFCYWNLAFDSRQKLIAAVTALTKEHVISFYQQAVIKPTGLALLSQVIGNNDKEEAYAAPEGWKIYPGASALQKTFSIKAY